MVAAASAHGNGHGAKGGGSKSGKTGRAESGRRVPPAATATAGEDADEKKFHDVEAFSLLNKKARGLRKKLTKIDLAVQAAAEGKPIAREQVDAIAKKDDTQTLAEEVEKWRDALAAYLDGEAGRVEAAVAERLAEEKVKWEASMAEKVKQAERRAMDKAKAGERAKAAEKKTSSPDKGVTGDARDVREIIALLYFSNLFSQLYPASMIERRACLQNATFVPPGGATGPTLLTNQDLSHIELMGKVVSMRSLHENENHMEAINKCAAAAGSFLSGDSREVMPGLGATFEGLKARLAGIIRSDYASAPPKPAGMMVMSSGASSQVVTPPGLRPHGSLPAAQTPPGHPQTVADPAPTGVPPVSQVAHEYRSDERAPYVSESELVLGDQRSVLVESTDPYEHVDGYGDEAADEVYYEYDESDFSEVAAPGNGMPNFGTTTSALAPPAPPTELGGPPPQGPTRGSARGGGRGVFPPRGRGEARGGLNARSEGARSSGPRGGGRGGGRGGASEGGRGRGRGRGRNSNLQGDTSGHPKRAPAPKDEWQSVPAKKKS